MCERRWFDAKVPARVSVALYCLASNALVVVDCGIVVSIAVAFTTHLHHPLSYRVVDEHVVRLLAMVLRVEDVGTDKGILGELGVNEEPVLRVVVLESLDDSHEGIAVTPNRVDLIGLPDGGLNVERPLLPVSMQVNGHGNSSIIMSALRLSSRA